MKTAQALRKERHRDSFYSKNPAVNLCLGPGFDSIKEAGIHFSSNVKELLMHLELNSPACSLGVEKVCFRNVVDK